MPAIVSVMDLSLNRLSCKDSLRLTQDWLLAPHDDGQVPLDSGHEAPASVRGHG